MSAGKELELDISVVRCTIDTRNKYPQDIFSSEFQFKGGRWRLNYYYEPACLAQYNLYLQKCSGVAPNPLSVSVQVESSRSGRIVPDLSEETRYTKEFEKPMSGRNIWCKREDEILRFFPESGREGLLKLLVLLQLEDTNSTENQIKCIVSEAAGQSSSKKSTDVQTTLLSSAVSCLESLSEDLAQLLVESCHDDVEFQCGGQSTRAHKSIVCSRSPVINSMLESDMVERRTGVVKIPDMEPDIFRQFLGYLYSGQLGELTFDTALRLYEAGDQYSVQGLAKRCSQYLLEHLSVDNACEALVVADAHSDKVFVEKVVDYMVDCKIPRTSDRWSAFADDHPKLAIKVLNRGWDDLK